MTAALPQIGIRDGIEVIEIGEVIRPPFPLRAGPDCFPRSINSNSSISLSDKGHGPVKTTKPLNKTAGEIGQGERR